MSQMPAGRYTKVRDSQGPPLTTPPVAGAGSGDPGDSKPFDTVRLFCNTFKRDCTLSPLKCGHDEQISRLVDGTPGGDI